MSFRQLTHGPSFIEYRALVFNKTYVWEMRVENEFAGGTVAHLVVLSPHSEKVLGSIPARDAVGAGGVLPPSRHQCPGLSVWSLHVLPVSPRVGTLTKNMQESWSLNCLPLASRGA